MLAMLPRLQTAPLHQISLYLTLTKKRISNVFVKGIFGYLLRVPLRVDTYNYVPTSITGSFSFTGSFFFHDYPKLYTFFGVRPF
jgi:hypothetical protein